VSVALLRGDMHALGRDLQVRNVVGGHPGTLHSRLSLQPLFFPVHNRLR
jgi:hypothetical protein